nr:hypothetical protein [Tanacetum cinerariifolium]
MERRFLSQKGSRRDDTMNTDTPSGGASAVQEGVTPYVVDMTGEVEKQNSLDDNTTLESFLPLFAPIPTEAGSVLGKSSYANVTGKPSRKKLNIRTLFTSEGNEIDVVVPGRSSYARVMIELRADVELKDNIVVVMPKITREVAGKKKTTKKPSQNSRGVSVGPKIGFKPQKEYRHVPKKPNANPSGNKKKGVEPTIKVSNSNLFDVLNSVDNDVKFGTNEGTTNFINNEAPSSRSSFMNFDNDGEFASNTPIGEKINKIERQIYEGKLRLLDNDRNPLVPTSIMESDTEVEVEVVFDETANLRILRSGNDRSDKGYGTNSLLELWRDSYPDNDDYDLYDDDMYENHDLSEHLQSFCDDLDIIVCGRKKK